MNPGHRIDYKALRKVNPETARLAVLEYLKSNGGNISHAARGAKLTKLTKGSGPHKHKCESCLFCVRLYCQPSDVSPRVTRSQGL